MARTTDTPRDECFRNSNSIKQAAETYCSFGSEASPGGPAAILWGDSYANQYLDPLSSSALANGIHGLIATQSACRPFLDDPARNSVDQQPCRDFNRSTLDFVLNHAEPSIVVLTGNWGSALEASALVDELLSSGKTVVLIMPLLYMEFDVPQRWMENQLRAGGAITEWQVGGRSKPDAERPPGRNHSGYRQAQRQSADWLQSDPQSVVCEHEHCYLVRNGQAQFPRSGSHLQHQCRPVQGPVRYGLCVSPPRQA